MNKLLEKNKEHLVYWFLPIVLILFGFAMRLLPHPANFAPIGAIALFGGMYLPKRLSIIAPLGALLVSDLFIGFYDVRIMLAVYVSFALMGFIGLWLRTHKAFFNTITGTLAGSLLFFLITNAAVWLFGTMYPHTFAGLMQSYVAAIPFFRNTIAGDLFYVGVLVGSFELFSYWLGVKVFTTKKIVFNQ